MGAVFDAANEATGAATPAEAAAGIADSTVVVVEPFAPPECDPLWPEPSEGVPPDGDTAEASAARASKPWLLMVSAIEKCEKLQL
jgi:hypothetical protein